LDSLVRIETFQWVARHFSEDEFSRFLSSRERLGDGGPYSRREEAQGSWGKHSLGSDFLQAIVCQSRSLSPQTEIEAFSASRARNRFRRGIAKLRAIVALIDRTK
jgi:hypothetical protein